MRPILRATAILGSGSAVSILVSLFSNKALATLIGPDGFGFMGLLQSLVELTTLIAGMGISVGLVRAGAKALADQDEGKVAALRRASSLVLGALGCLALLLLILFSVPISTLMLGSQDHAWSVVLMGMAVLFTLASSLQIGTLNAYHRIGALAKTRVLSSVVATGFILVLVFFMREQGIVPAVIVATATGWAVSRYFLRREVKYTPVPPTRNEVVTAARSLLRFGGPYTLSMLVGTGVQLALPSLVVHALDTSSVGFYRASLQISAGYLGFLLAAMGQDYYPRLSAASGKPAILTQMVNEQHRLVMLLGIPLILGLMAFSPYLVPLIYSPEFTPTIQVLEWQLIGDIFKFSSWTMGFVILARSGSGTYFCTELVGGLTNLLFSWIGIQWLGLAGAGVGFLATYVVYYLVTWSVLRREIGLTWSTENKLMMSATVLAAVIIRVLPFAGLESLKTPAALLFALIAAVISLYIIWGELRRKNVAPGF